MKSRFVLIFLMGLALVFVLVPGARAETTDRISKLDISIWPEYDDPTVLIQYDGEFAVKENFPRDVSLYLPTGANVIASAYVTDKGEYLNTDPWQTKDAGNGWSRMTVKLPTPHFHIEFYYDGLKGAPDKTLNFVYQAAQATDAIHVEVQQPLKAENFKTVPPAKPSTSQTHGFTYHSIDYPTLNAEQTLNVAVSYTKTDPNPSIVYIQTTSPTTTPNSATQPATAASANSSNWILPTVLVSVGLAMGGLGFYYWWSRRRLEAVRVSTRAARRSASRSSAGAAVFCWQCGNGLNADDNFCPRCGAARRK